MRCFPRPLSLLVCGLGLAVLGLSCAKGSGRLACYPVRGRVLYQGKPLPNMLVLFYPVNPTTANAPSASGLTDEEGWFTLSTYDTEDGAPAGEYDVGISQETGAFRRQKGGLRKGKQTEPDPLNGRYQNPRTSHLRVRIEAQDNELAAFRLP